MAISTTNTAAAGEQPAWWMGFNFQPADTINTVELWQKETFDEAAIDKELALAARTGFNCLRVFLQYLVWEADPDGFKTRLDRLLTLAHTHGIRVMPVLFDDCAFGENPEPFLGKQPEVRLGYFYNGWVPSPGAKRVNDPAAHPKLRDYVLDLLRRFRGDPRVLAWDLYNEPSPANVEFVKKVFAWAREAGADRPLMAGPCNLGTVDLNHAIWERSDICGFHCYGGPDDVRKWLDEIRPYGKPVICTEWLNRQPTLGSVPEAILPVLYENNVGAIIWGLVNGRSQTHLWWGARPGQPPPVVWQHDIFHTDHTPYIPAEIELFKAYGARARAADAAPLPAAIRVDAATRGVDVGPHLYGLFFEDINHAADGGLYGEMVRNRGFEAGRTPEGCRMENGHVVNPKGWKQAYSPDPLEGWKALHEGYGEDVSLEVVTDRPLTPANPASLRMTIRAVGTTRGGVVNEGWWGMALKKGADYRLRLHARAENFTGPLTVSLETIDRQVAARAEFSNLTADWQRFDAVLRSAFNTNGARLVIGVAATGTVWLDMVSLFPADTFKGRPNGMRADVAQMLADLKPGFLRFPGGCIVEGVTLENRVQWKKTLGDIADRPGHWNLWNYPTTDGLGFHEYLQFCEDIGAAPMYIANVGMSCQARAFEHVEGSALDPYLRETLDALEYANGPATSTWGAARAAAGHPAPFNIRYVGIGNENGGPVYHANYQRFFDAIKAAYPGVLTIACQKDPAMGKIEIFDEHFYSPPEFFLGQTGRYDAYDRKGPRVFVGEFATVHKGGMAGGRPTLLAAVAEAAFMTGMERNADIVTMASYAPLLANVNDQRWNPDLIYYDASRVFGTPSYHVQKLFAHNRPAFTHPVAETAAPAVPTVHAAAGRDAATGELIVKIVNPLAHPVRARLDIAPFEADGGTAHLVTSAQGPEAENSLDAPQRVSLRTAPLACRGSTLDYLVPAYAVAALRLKEQSR